MTATQTSPAAWARAAGEHRVPVLTADEAVAVAADRRDSFARAATTDACVRVSSRLFEVAGTRSVSDGLHLHRHWRHARTPHDPAAWKVQHLGRWALDRRLPPSHAQI
ncbi:MAG TPA: hypothetical protein VHR35_07535 [Nocardioides sp.]|jgi:alkylation response protein AidB-like acyl-CoA dehydrogenase|nr:hypothetical protein [Nocardioides sp.]